MKVSATYMEHSILYKNNIKSCEERKAKTPIQQLANVL